MDPGVLHLGVLAVSLLGRAWAATGSCIPIVYRSGNSCPEPIRDASTCEAAASAHPQVVVNGAVRAQSAYDRPAGCWWQESNGYLFLNRPSPGDTPPNCSEDRSCICCSPYITSPMTVTSISHTYAIRGVPTVITLNGTVAPGDRVAWAEDCSTAMPSKDPGNGTAEYTITSEGTFKLCYRANGTTESVQQTGIQLEVFGPCVPELITSGRSGTCQWPMESADQCSYRARFHEDIANDSVATSQSEIDRPIGCWSQASNGGLFLNEILPSVTPVDCSEAFKCVCCKVTSTSTTSATSTTATTTTATITTATVTTTTTITTTTTTTSMTTTTTMTTTTVTTITVTAVMLTTTTNSSTTTASTTTTITTTPTATATTTTTPTATTTNTTTNPATTTTISTTPTTTTITTTPTATTTITTTVTTATITTTPTATTTISITTSATVTITATTSTTITTSDMMTSTSSVRSATTPTSTTSATTTTTTTTSTLGDSFLGLSFRVANVDYHGLVADLSVLSACERAIKNVIVLEAANGIETWQVSLELSPGSTNVFASMHLASHQQPNASAALESSQSLQPSLLLAVLGVPGIQRVSVGPLQVLHVRVHRAGPAAATTTAATCGGILCPVGYAARPQVAGAPCPAQPCSVAQCCEVQVVEGDRLESSAAMAWAIVGVSLVFAALACATASGLVYLRRRRSGGPRPGGQEGELSEVQVEAPEVHVEAPAPADEPTGAAACHLGTCPQGDALLHFTAPWSGDFSCDRCERDMQEGDAAWSCDGGRYTVCRACAGMSRAEACSQALALQEDREEMVAMQPPKSVMKQTAPDAVSLDTVDLQMPNEGRNRPQTGVQAAIRTVNATSSRLSKIMLEVQRAPSSAIPTLLAQARDLENSSEYTRARCLLASLAPDVAGVDPLGGVVLG